MQIIELHILQSYPVSCLNRDVNGSPKSARFGGVDRARISSQCLKRATRDHARAEYPSARFEGVRSKRLLQPFIDAMQAHGLAPDPARACARAACNCLSSLKNEAEGIVTTLVYLSPTQIERIAAGVAAAPPSSAELNEFAKDKPDKKKQKPTALDKRMGKIVNEAMRAPLDAADIALFGRMIANDASLNVEAAALFSHALSVHGVANELDFYSAVDDRRGPEAEDAGAAMIGDLEFNSAVYYRYVGLNLGMLADADHLGGLSAEDRRAVVQAFVRSVMAAVPGARQATMNADTRPGFVLGLYRSAGQPLQLVNAFLKPVTQDRSFSLLDAARTRMDEHHRNLSRVWENPPDIEVLFTEDGDMTISAFVEELTARVP